MNETESKPSWRERRRLRKERRQNGGRMPLREHLVELRNRLGICIVALILAAVVGWFLYEPVFAALSEPINRVNEQKGHHAVLNFAGVGTAIDVRIKVSFFIAVILSSPVWIYQVWRFIVPGLTKKERTVSLIFILVAIPLFLSGCYVAWLALPNVVVALTEFTPTGAENTIHAAEYLNFTMQLVLAFGLAFLLPIVLVGLNWAGILTSRQILGFWRPMIVIVAAFSAVVTPTPDVTSMLFVAIPMVVLYFLAVGFTYLLDRRKVKKQAQSEQEIEEYLDNPTLPPTTEA